MNEDCDLAEREVSAARYVAGRLDAAAIEHYELHLLVCAPCREDVHQAAALRAALRAMGARRRLVRLAPVGLVAAAGIAWLLLAPGPLERIGRLDQPPAAHMMPVRGDPDSADVFAQRGLDAYNRGQYRDAGTWLGRAFSLRPETGTAFYGAAAFLAVQQPDSALRLLRAATADARSVYAGEAHLLAARAWLQKEDDNAALRHLRNAELLGPARVRTEAAALRNAIQRRR